jgi:pimeloyl-ACP methyl ester carboxylesterase
MPPSEIREDTMHQRIIFCCLLLLVFHGRAVAQPDQYELGRRIGAFELAWEKNTDANARKNAIGFLRPATMMMLTSQLNEAGRAFDEARHALTDTGPVPGASLWADSLCVRLASRLIDAKDPALPFTVEQFYKPKAPPEKDARLGLQLIVGLGGKLVQVPLSQVPMTGSLPLTGTSEGDYMLHITIRVGDRVAAQTLFRVSVVKDLKPRLEKLKNAVSAFGSRLGSTDQESVREIFEALDGLDKGQTRQSDYPASRLLAEAEHAVEAIQQGKSFYGGDKAGQFWLRLPNGNSGLPVRLLAPDSVKDNKKPLPLVIAMHGLLGSENLFFEAFGSGLTVKLCRDRGWLLVAPHNRPLGNYSTDEVINEVAKLYPVNTRNVFLIGHSLGAHQAVNAAMQSPGRIAAVAALAGGQIKVKSDVRNISFFIGIGNSDPDPLAMLAARGLNNNLKKAGVQNVEFRQYPEAEHFLIVREALPDVFAMFDKISRIQ